MLCDKCKIIKLDAQLYGLEEITLDDGQIVLDFGGRFLGLEYDRWDSFPDFPDLQSSAQEGCGFCDLLRTTLQDHYAPKFAPLSKNRAVDRRIHLSNLGYRWTKLSRRGNGIDWLEINASNTDLDVNDNFRFYVMADEGLFHYNTGNDCADKV
jgi:hypothetical protein